MKRTADNLSEVKEDYLETILLLSKGGAPVRLIDISKAHGVSKSTVSDALSSLGEHGYVIYEKYRPVILTAKGREVAECVLNRHKLLGSTPKSVDFNERRRIGQGPSIDNFDSRLHAQTVSPFGSFAYGKISFALRLNSKFL